MQMKTMLLAGLVAAVGSVTSWVSAQETSIGWVEISGSPSDAPGPFDWLNPDAEIFADILGAFEKAAEDDSIKGVVVRLKDAQLNFTQIEELGVAMAALRSKGKPVHVFAETYGTPELLVASHADEALIQTGGGVYLSGLYMEEMYLTDMLSWIGMTPQFVQVGDYKGANETFMRSEPSPEWDRNINRLLDGLYGNMRQTMQEGRELSDTQLDAAMTDLWMANAEQAIEHGVLDAAVDLPLIIDHLESRYGGEIVVNDSLVSGSGGELNMNDPFALFRMLSATPESGPDGPAIAVLHVNGAIIDGDSSPPGLFGGGGSVGSRTIRNAIEDILAEDDIQGVVVRIDSPGGSATASEVMWQGLRRLSESKPVWVSVGSMAASGGYYTAVGGDKIYVNPSSIVGSIGVVGGKISMADTYNHLKLNVHSRARGPRSAMFGSNAPWSTEDVAAVREKMTQTYDLFTSRVSAGRSEIDLSKTAEGRLFTGTQAIAMRMADEIGGLSEAIEDLAIDLEMDEYEIVHYPAPKGLNELFEDMFSMASAPNISAVSQLSPAIAALREVVGPQRWDGIASALDAGVRFRTEPVQVIMPRVLLFK
jgi:protease IV